MERWQRAQRSAARNWQQAHENDCPDATNQTSPFALIENTQRGLRIYAANQAAEEKGITAGLPLADAKALFPELRTEEAAPARDLEGLKRLALWCLRYSPLVTTHPPDGIAIDITGCAHLFDGEDAMLRLIEHQMQVFDLSAQLALSDTIGASWAAARFMKTSRTILTEGAQRRALAPLPVEALRLPPDIVLRLKQVGIRQISSLIDAPKPPLVTRFGAELVTRLEQAIGQSAEIFNPIAPAPIYEVRRPLMEPIRHLEAVELILEDMATNISAQLLQDNAAARRLDLFLFRVDGHVERLEARTSRLCNKAEHITLLFKERLSRLQEEIDIGFGYDLLLLGVYDVEPAEEKQLNWAPLKREEETSLSSEEISRLLDRFGNRFGFDRILHFQPFESHIPEKAIQVEVFSNRNRSSQWASQKENSSARPFLLLDRVEPITVLAEVPDGPPIRFQWRRQQHEVIAADGPERIAPEWWQTTKVEQSFQTRDYYRVEDQQGRRFWLYRDGLYNREQDHPRWFMQGLFP
ncbi:DUF6504 family protein [Sneathiella sp. P13V-1]|uniref:DUF6504 family protein n=1 Tax=Sneathiella sp. P13V-1 TaxID=2697366 RepID=UPI002AAF8824|nr:DUF6504 family protein [Sneathiella sp. P13V-1]